MVADSVFGEDAVVAVAIVGNVDAGINVTEVAVTDGIAIDAVVGNVVDAGINVIDWGAIGVVVVAGAAVNIDVVADVVAFNFVFVADAVVGDVAAAVVDVFCLS